MFKFILTILGTVAVATTVGYLLGYFLGLLGILLSVPTGFLIGAIGFLIADRIDDAY